MISLDEAAPRKVLGVQLQMQIGRSNISELAGVSVLLSSVFWWQWNNEIGASCDCWANGVKAEWLSVVVGVADSAVYRWRRWWAAWRCKTRFWNNQWRVACPFAGRVAFGGLLFHGPFFDESGVLNYICVETSKEFENDENWKARRTALAV